MAQATKEALPKGTILPLGLLGFEVRIECGLGPRVLGWPLKKMWIFDASDHSRVNEPQSQGV